MLEVKKDITERVHKTVTRGCKYLWPRKQQLEETIWMSDCCLELCEFLMHFILLWLPTMFCLSRLFLSFTLISFVSSYSKMVNWWNNVRTWNFTSISTRKTYNKQIWLLFRGFSFVLQNSKKKVQQKKDKRKQLKQVQKKGNQLRVALECFVWSYWVAGRPGSVNVHALIS